jgi:hypothetical protein
MAWATRHDGAMDAPSAPLPLDAMVAAWQMAGRELGVRVEAPYSLQTADGRCYQCVAKLPDFGSPAGTVALCLGMAGEDRVREAARSLGFYCMSLSPRVYARYRPMLFEDTLNDWNWFGEPRQTPPWYNGKAWS